MTWLHWLTLWLSPLGLFACYLVYIQHEHGGAWIVCKYIGGIPGYLPDVLWNVILCLCMGRLPTKLTITMELPGLAKMGGRTAEVAIALANFLNWFAPSGKHVNLR